MRRWLGWGIWLSLACLGVAHPLVDRMGMVTFRFAWSAMVPPATHVQVRSGSVWVAHQGTAETPPGVMILDGLTGKLARQHPVGSVVSWAQSPGVSWVSSVGKGLAVWRLRDPMATRWQLPTMIPVQLAVDDLDSDGVDDGVCRDASGRLMAVGGRTGTPLWRYPRRIASASMVLDDVSRDGVRDVLVSVGWQVVALDGRTGKPHWGVTLNASGRQMVGLPDDLAVLDANREVQWVGREGVLGVRVSVGEIVGNDSQLIPLAADRVLVMGHAGGAVVTKAGRVIPVKSGGVVGSVGSWRSETVAWVVTGNQLGALNQLGEWVVSAPLPEPLRLPPLLGDANANGVMELILVGVSGRIRVYEIRGMGVVWQGPFGNLKNTMGWDDPLDAYPPYFISPYGHREGKVACRISDGMGPVRLMTTVGRLRRALPSSYRLMPPTPSERRWTVWQDGTLHLYLGVSQPIGGTADQATIRRVETRHPCYQLEGVGVGTTLSSIREQVSRLGEWEWDATGSTGRVSHYPWVTVEIKGQTVERIWVE